METRRSAVDPVRATDPELPDEHQGWGVEGYAGGETVPSAETPGWGAEGHVEATEPGERAPGPADPTGPPGDLTSARVDPGIDDPHDDPDPGSHPASALAGR